MRRLVPMAVSTGPFGWQRSSDLKVILYFTCSEITVCLGGSLSWKSEYQHLECSMSS